MVHLFEIQDFFSGSFSLGGDSPMVEAKTGREALNIYLKEIGIKVKTKISGENEVHFCVTPMIIENGVKYINGSKRKAWYKVIN